MFEKVWSKKIEENFKEEIIFNPNTKKKILVIDTPPPYPGPFWHIGAALSYTLIDIVARILRMLNYEVLFPIGFDRNGIPVEWYVEKYEGIKMQDLPREKFLEVCKNALDKYVENMENIMKKLLISADFKNKYFTDSEEYRAFVQKTFYEIWKKDLVYKDLKPSLFCTHCKTTIALAEIERIEKEGILYYIKFKIKDSNEEILVATTRPELLEACRFLAFNPKDKRYKKLNNKEAIVPIFNFSVPIKERKEIDINYGSGIMMVCSYGDLDDVKILREENIEPKIVLDENGNYKGKDILEARREIIEELKQKNLIEKEEKIIQNLPVHDKCKSRVEILLMEEYFLKQIEFKNSIKEISKKIKFFPNSYKKRLLNWVNSISIDWPISRRRYYATEIPIWYCKNCNNVFVANDGNYHQPWKENLNISCNNCGRNEWIGEQRTFDTWFDSSVSVLFVTRNLENKNFLKLRPQGYEIIRTWLYYTLLRVFQLTNEKAFDFVLIHGMGLDEQGRKMSKSLGNVILPEEILEIGAEPARLYFSFEYSLGSDYRIQKEKILAMQRFLTKLLNIANFISQFKYVDLKTTENTDKWILSELMILKKKVIKNYKQLKINLALQEIHNFVYELFSSHYIEMVKKRAFNNDESAISTLYFCFKEILKLLYPIIPATTSYIYEKLYKGKIESFGKVEKKLINKDLCSLTNSLINFNSQIWKFKKERNLSLKDPIEMEIPEELKVFEKDLVEMHNLIKK